MKEKICGETSKLMPSPIISPKEERAKNVSSQDVRGWQTELRRTDLVAKLASILRILDFYLE